MGKNGMQFFKCIVAFLLCSLLSIPAMSATEKVKTVAKSDSFNLLEASNSGLTEVLLNIANGHTVLTIIDAKPGLTLDVEVGQFHGEQGDIVIPKIVYSGTAARTHKNIRVESAFLELPLNVILPNPGKYQGVISFTTKGGESKKWKFSLSRAGVTRSAILVVDQNAISPTSVTRSVTCLPFLACSRWNSSVGATITAYLGLREFPSFSTRLLEKNRTWPLNNINVRLDGAAKAPGEGFDLSNDIEFKFDGAEWENKSERTVAVEKQAEVTGHWTTLEAGEYSIPLRFSATNSDDNDSQKLTLTMHVRDSIIWSIIVLAIAIAFSMGATKLNDSKRKQLKFKTTIDELRSEGLGQDKSSLPVVWARATLKQAEDLSGRSIIASAEVIEQRLIQAVRVIGILDRARELRVSLDNMRMQELIRPRAETAIGRIFKQIDPEHIDDATVQKRKDEIDQLAQWVENSDNPAQQMEIYWRDLSTDIDALLRKIDANLPDGKEINSLANDLRGVQGIQPRDIKEVIARDQLFQVLRIFWRWHDQPEFSEFLAIRNPERSLDALFELADKKAWERLRNSELRVRLINNIGDASVEAYETLLFDVTSDDKVVNESYLFKHELKYKWNLVLSDSRNSTTLKPETTEPHLAQYAPGPGKLTVKVYVEYGKDVKVGEYSCDTNKEISVITSKRFDSAKEAMKYELSSTLYVGILALISGLSLYYKNPSFGSIEDYLLLFLWGAGLDQGKNWVQISKQP